MSEKLSVEEYKALKRRSKRDFLTKMGIGGAFAFLLGSQLPIPKVFAATPTAIQVTPEYIHFPPLASEMETGAWGADEEGRVWLYERLKKWDGSEIRPIEDCFIKDTNGDTAFTSYDGSPFTLYESTNERAIQGYVNLEDMAADDVIEIVVQVKTSSGGTYRALEGEGGTYTHAQDEDIKPIGPIVNYYSVKVTIELTAGTAGAKSAEWVFGKDR